MGVENPGYLSSRRMILSVSAFQHGRDLEPEPDETVEKLLSRGPEMFMAPDHEFRERRVALDRGYNRLWRRV